MVNVGGNRASANPEAHGLAYELVSGVIGALKDESQYRTTYTF